MKTLAGSLSALQKTVKHVTTSREFDRCSCYSPLEMAQDQPVAALVVALKDDLPAVVIRSIACVRNASASSCRSPRNRWWKQMSNRTSVTCHDGGIGVPLSDVDHFPSCYRTLARPLPAMLRAWEIGLGALVVDMERRDRRHGRRADPGHDAMDVSRIASLVEQREGREGDPAALEGGERLWISVNPDEGAEVSRREAFDFFSTAVRAFVAAGAIFRADRKPCQRRPVAAVPCTGRLG